MTMQLVAEGRDFDSLPVVEGGELWIFVNRVLTDDECPGIAQDGHIVIIKFDSSAEMLQVVNRIPDDSVVGWQVFQKNSIWAWVLRLLAVAGFLKCRST